MNLYKLAKKRKVKWNKVSIMWHIVVYITLLFGIYSIVYNFTLKTASDMYSEKLVQQTVTEFESLVK